MTPQRRHKGLQRAGRILRPLVRPEQVGQAIGRDAMTARGEQDFQHLLRPGAPQVTRTQRAAAVLDRERPEQADHKAPRFSFYAHALRHPHAIGLLNLCSTVVSARRLLSLRRHDSLHLICVRADAPLTSEPGPERNDCPAMRHRAAMPHGRRQLEHADMIIAAGGAAGEGLGPGPCATGFPLRPHSAGAERLQTSCEPAPW